MTTSTTTREAPRHPAWAVVGATAAAIAAWVVARAADVDLEVTTWGGETMDVGLAVVTAAALGASLAGWGLLALLRRRTDRADELWTAIAVIVLVLSLPGPLLVDASTGARISLTLMHLAVGVVLIPGLRSPATRAASLR